ncbi:MAG: hypothetical protein IKO44_02895 [Ruminococcus sp.]|nr:hypothetical protein [Ruminococcus sp.]
MIRQVFSPCEELLSQLSHNHYSRRVKSHYFAYKTDYDFSRIFEISDEGKALGAVAVFNASMIVASCEGITFDTETLEELAGFILMIAPTVVEIEPRYADTLKPLLAEDYTIDHRTQFEFVSRNELPDLEVNELPKLDDVFRVLASSFPSIAESYELWTTDTSHRIRRGLSQSFLLGDYTTATIQYIVDKVALIGHVATIPERRGEFHARRLLYWIGERLTRDGFTVRLFARPHRVSYYEEIGFRAIEHDIVFERKEPDDN